MSECRFNKSWLQSWLDGEPGEHAAEARAHLAHCSACAAEVDAWRRAGDELRDTVDEALGQVEPLVALARIRERIARAERASWRTRLQRFVDDLLLFRRRLVAGVAVAAALGALTAPAVVYWAGQDLLPQYGPMSPVVVVESLEVGGNTTAVVMGAGDSTTLIWVEPGADGNHAEPTF